MTVTAPPRLALRLLSIALCLGLCCLAAPRAAASDPSDQALIARLTGDGADSVAAMESVLADANTAGTVPLFLASRVALREERVGDAAFLFYIAKLRASLDHEVYPPIGTGGDSPMLVVMAFGQQLGAAVNPRIMREPGEFARTLERVQAWQPVFTDDHAPGWDHRETRATAEAFEVLANLRAAFDAVMGETSRMLLIPDYFAAFETVQDFNLKTGADRPDEAAYETAIELMETLEAEHGATGASSLVPH